MLRPRVLLNQECTAHYFLSSKKKTIPRIIIRNHRVQTIRSRVRYCDVKVQTFVQTKQETVSWKQSPESRIFLIFPHHWRQHSYLNFLRYICSKQLRFLIKQYLRIEITLSNKMFAGSDKSIGDSEFGNLVVRWREQDTSSGFGSQIFSKFWY